MQKKTEVGLILNRKCDPRMTPIVLNGLHWSNMASDNRSNSSYANQLRRSSSLKQNVFFLRVWNLYIGILLEDKGSNNKSLFLAPPGVI